MPKKKFKCSRCDRSFSMAAHLARHRNTIHGSGRAKAAKKGGRGRRGKPIPSAHCCAYHFERGPSRFRRGRFNGA